MVPPACDARLVGLILAVFTGATCASARNGFAEPRDREPKSPLSRSRPAAETAPPAFEPAKMPANCGLCGRDQETPVRIGLHGGAGRIRTSNQTVMSVVHWPRGRPAHPEDALARFG